MTWKKTLHGLTGLLIVGAYFLSAPYEHWEQPGFRATPASDSSGKVLPLGEAARWQWHYASDGETPLVHAASMIELPDGRIRAFWFAGSREGGRDVGIHSAVFDPAAGRWSQETRVLSRADVMAGTGRFIRKLGNAVPVLHDDGRLDLYVVSATLGGWATSSINLATSTDGGASFTATRWLVTSPFLNLSTLVKAPAIRFQDGTLGLPVYHELAGKFGEVIRLDKQGRILELQRIGEGRKAIQPVVLVQDSEQATALLRNEDEQQQGFVWRADTHYGGRPWGALKAGGMANPGSAIGALALGPQHWLMAGNCNPDERDDLCIQETTDGGASWQTALWVHDQRQWRKQVLYRQDFDAAVLDTNQQTDNPLPPATVLDLAHRNKCLEAFCRFQYDYPYLLQARNGDVHLLYTWNKSLIRHGWFKASPSTAAVPADTAVTPVADASPADTPMHSEEK